LQGEAVANYYAIAAVSATIRGLLADARTQPEISSAQIELFQVSDFQKPKFIEEGVSIFLYRVGISSSQRNLSAGIDLRGRRRRPTLPVDLYYLMTAWGKTAAKQQLILGWMLRTLEDLPTWDAELLNHYGGSESTFDTNETITLIPDSLSLQDLANLWDILKPNAQVSVAYIARMIHLESILDASEGEPVQTREFQYAKVTNP
jgi:hypothetical protein